MRLTILDEQSLRLETTEAATADGGLEVTGAAFGPLPMLAASLALCTASAVLTYGQTAGIDLEGLVIEVRWSLAERPRRVDRYEMTLQLSERLPEARRQAIRRAAETCTVHHTLLQPPEIVTTIATVV